MKEKTFWETGVKPIPDWNRSKPLESFQLYAEAVNEQAKIMLVSSGHHANVMIFVDLNGNSQVVLWRGDNKETKAKWMEQHIHDHYIYGVIHVFECWARLNLNPYDETTKQLLSGERRISQLPRNQRLEVLSVVAQSRDGYSQSWMNEIVRDSNGKVKRIGMVMQFDEMAGRFGEMFS